jgi:hypothetical protein
MEYLTLNNMLIVLLVVSVVYYLYNKTEGFAEKHHHAHHGKHHTHHAHNTHHNKNHKVVETHTKSAAEVKEAPKWNRLPGKDFWGFDLYQTKGGTVDECEKVCEEDPFCTHVAWYPDRSNTCYHKGINAAGNPPVKYTAGFKTATGEYKTYLRGDLSGFDLPGSGGKSPSMQDCESTCNNTANCVNFTYGSNDQACYLKGPYGSEKGVPATTILTLKP